MNVGDMDDSGNDGFDDQQDAGFDTYGEAQVPEIPAGLRNKFTAERWEDIDPDVRDAMVTRERESESNRLEQLARAISEVRSGNQQQTAKPDKAEGTDLGPYGTIPDDRLKAGLAKGIRSLLIARNLPDDPEERAEALRAAGGIDPSEVDPGEMVSIIEELGRRAGRAEAQTLLGKDMEVRKAEKARSTVAQTVLERTGADRTIFDSHGPVYRRANEILEEDAHLHGGKPSNADMVRAFVQAHRDVGKPKASNSAGGAGRDRVISDKARRAEIGMRKEHEALVRKGRAGDKAALAAASRLAMQRAFAENNNY